MIWTDYYDENPYVPTEIQSGEDKNNMNKIYKRCNFANRDSYLVQLQSSSCIEQRDKHLHKSEIMLSRALST